MSGLGLSVPEIGNWQYFLNDLNFHDADGNSLKVDESWGAKTTFATKEYQKEFVGKPTGVLDDVTRASAEKQGFIPFIQAKNCTILHPKARANPALIVIHTMENPSKPGEALAVAKWFAGSTAPQASAHYCVDSERVIQCVRDLDVAWHAPGANRNGIGIEHAGYAKQSAQDWSSAYNEAMLKQSSWLCAKLCARYNIPIVKLGAHDLQDPQGGSLQGITGHVDITAAFSHGVGHYDPGPNFPWEHYIELVKEVVV